MKKILCLSLLFSAATVAFGDVEPIRVAPTRPAATPTVAPTGQDAAKPAAKVKKHAKGYHKKARSKKAK